MGLEDKTATRYAYVWDPKDRCEFVHLPSGDARVWRRQKCQLLANLADLVGLARPSQSLLLTLRSLNGDVIGSFEIGKAQPATLRRERPLGGAPDPGMSSEDLALPTLQRCWPSVTGE
jgi:hypothetical protein